MSGRSPCQYRRNHVSGAESGYNPHSWNSSISSSVASIASSRSLKVGSSPAHSDPNVPPLEAATREELQQKIQAKLVAALGEAFPGIQLPQQGKQVTFAMHVDRNPGGGFTVHSDNPGTPGFNPAAQEKLDHYAEELLGFVDKHFPHLSEQIAAQVTGREIQVFTSRTISTSGQQSSPLSPMFLPTQPMQPSDVTGQQAPPATTTIEDSDLNQSLLGNTPITPEASKSGPIVRFLLTLLIIAAVMYFFFYRR